MKGIQRFSFFLLFLATPFVYGQEVLRWGADSEGGAPYIFQDPAHPARIIGFEVDLVNAIAQEMNKKSEFIQNQWDSLIPGLNRKNYDIVVNGLEITEDRKAEILFSAPYYVTYEQLTVRQETQTIESLKDCKNKVVGTLKASLAHRMLEAQKDIHIRSYDGQVNPYQDLQNQRLDAVLMDFPIALYYGVPNPKLKSVGAPIGRMEYGIGIRKEDTQLAHDINAALKRLSHTGKLREIYERWGLWNSTMAEFLNDLSPSRIPPMEYEAYLKTIGMKRGWKEKIHRYGSYLPLLAKGALMTVELSFLAMVMAVILGLGITLIRLYTPAPLPWLATSYVEVIRGTPLLIQLFFIFYALPSIGIIFSPFVAALVGLGLNYAAYEAENYRAGILAIPRHQMEAALALGMSKLQALRHIIIPQAVRIIIPPITNDFISLLKDSSLVSVITLVELTKMYGQLAATYYDYLGTGVMVAIAYFLIGLPFVRLSRWAEKYFSFDRERLPQKIN